MLIVAVLARPQKPLASAPTREYNPHRSRQLAERLMALLNLSPGFLILDTVW
jgi:hypothetical protein